MGGNPLVASWICRLRMTRLLRPFCRSCSFKCCGGWRYLHGGSFLWHLPCNTKSKKYSIIIFLWLFTCATFKSKFGDKIWMKHKLWTNNCSTLFSMYYTLGPFKVMSAIYPVKSHLLGLKLLLKHHYLHHSNWIKIRNFHPLVANLNR